MNYKDELYHYGVLGMKWGIRRYQPYSVKPRGSGKRGREIGDAARYAVRKTGTAVANTAKRVGRLVSKPIARKVESVKTEREKKEAIVDRQKAVNDIRTLTDAEIKARIDRLKNEQELKRLTTKDLEPGKAFIDAIMSDVGKKVLTTTLTGAAIYGAKWLIDHDFDVSEFAKSVYRGGASKK